MADTPVLLYVATYGSEADAHVDYKAVKALHKDHVVGAYDAASGHDSFHAGVPAR